MTEQVNWTAITPKVLSNPTARRLIRACALQLARLDGNGATASTFLQIRNQVAEQARGLSAAITPTVVLCAYVLCDLRAQGWRIRVPPRRIDIAPPQDDGGSAEKRKAQIRAAHLLERDAQLCQAPTRHFVQDMERRRRHHESWHSIFSLMRDGRALGESLQRAAELPLGPDRLEALRQCVAPYIQVVESGVTCEFTGLKLTDVWRYFRHTWNTVYFSTPGRKVWFLVRDGAAPNHPVVGIGAMGSSIVQLAPRDQWIGWTSKEFLAKLREKPTVAWARWLQSSLSTLIDEIFVNDFRSEGVLRKGELAAPTPSLNDCLRKIAAEAWKSHRLYPTRQKHKSTVRDADEAHWKSEARTYLFRAKRAEHLAELLEARRLLFAAGFTAPTARNLRFAIDNRSAVRAIGTVLRRTKAAHIGVDMMDITICGAVAPYNSLLGGKLVALLMASPEAIAVYNRRYRNSASVIASSMAGRPVHRSPKLVLLGTTSLYGVASSQYNRLRMPADAVGGHPADELAFVPLGRTVGFGSFHFSRDTMQALEIVLARERRGRPVNSIFGEGVNPKLRKVRTALDLLGLPSDILLQHGSPRLIYVVPLARNFRQVLFGRMTRVRPIVPDEPGVTNRIVEFWRQRWLANRINNATILETVAAHTLAYPVRHGARVVLPPLLGEEGLPFGEVAVSQGDASAVVAAATLPRDGTPTSATAAGASGG